jgi:hypothetical protein
MQGTKTGIAKNKSEEIGQPTPGGLTRRLLLDGEKQGSDSQSIRRATRVKESRILPPKSRLGTFGLVLSQFNSHVG